VEEGAIKVLQYALAAAEQTIRIKLTIKQRESVANNGNLGILPPPPSHYVYLTVFIYRCYSDLQDS
jgi:hypothetical protein